MRATPVGGQGGEQRTCPLPLRAGGEATKSREEGAKKVERPPLVCLCPARVTMPISQGTFGTKHHKHTACTLAVYAPQRELPHHHVRLASDWWPAFVGREWLPDGSHYKVSVPILTTSSLTRLPWRVG